MLKLDSGTLGQIIERDLSASSPITRIVERWFSQFPMEDSDRWEELGRVLMEPAVREPGIACKIQPHLRRGSSVDSAISDMMLSSPRSSVDTDPPHYPHYQLSFVGVLSSG